jgi:hypothetical protein
VFFDVLAGVAGWVSVAALAGRPFRDLAGSSPWGKVGDQKSGAGARILTEI